MPEFDEFFHTSSNASSVNTSTVATLTAASITTLTGGTSNNNNNCLNGYQLHQPPRSQSSCSNGSTASHLTNGSTDHPTKTSSLMSGPPSAGSNAGAPNSYLEGECHLLLFFFSSLFFSSY